MSGKQRFTVAVVVCMALTVAAFVAVLSADPRGRLTQMLLDKETDSNAVATVKRGREIFRPLRGLWTHQRGGFYHDGRFATLTDVVNHYDQFFQLNLNEQAKRDLVEYLKSL